MYVAEDDNIEEKIEKFIIPNIKYHRRIDFNTLEEYYEASISLNYIEKFFYEEDYDYIFKYLAKNDILVYGNSQALYRDYENYVYFPYNKAINNDKYNYNSEQIKKLICEYQSEEKSDKKVQLKQEIYLQCYKFVEYITREFCNKRGLYYKDFLGASYEGLSHAIEYFNANYDVFYSYISKVIRGYLLREIPIMQNFYQIRTYEELLSSKQEVEKLFGKKNQRFQDIREDILDIYFEKKSCNYEEQQKMRSKLYFNAPEYFSDLEDTEVLIANQEEQMIEDIYQQEISDTLKAKLKELPVEVTDYIIELWGLNGEKPKTLREIASKHNISYETVRSRMNKAYSKLSCDDKLRSLYKEKCYAKNNY